MGRGKNRGRRKRKEQGGPSRRDLSDEELDAALAEIEAGSDRVAATMGAALVENTLVGAILTCLKDKGESDKLFDDVKGPFNTFYAKTLAGRALGLFGATTEEALHAVREIRNKFAHLPHCLDFTDAEIAKKVATKLKPLDEEAAESAKLPPSSETRAQFESACYSLTIELTRATAANYERIAAEAQRQIALLHPDLLGEIYERVAAAPEDSE
jgi:hypothetical protein